MNQTWENNKKPNFGPPYFFLEGFTSSAIIMNNVRKTKGPILRKLSDGQMERWMDRWTDRQTKVFSQDGVRLASSIQ